MILMREDGDTTTRQGTVARKSIPLQALGKNGRLNMENISSVLNDNCNYSDNDAHCKPLCKFMYIYYCCSRHYFILK